MESGLKTYEQIALGMGVPRGTLSRKVADFNRKHEGNPGKQIKPDEVVDHGHYRVHMFNAAGILKVEAAVLSMTTRRRGRPIKPKA